MSTPSDNCSAQPEAWIGLARVQPRAGNTRLGSGAGAVAPVLALACNQDDLVAKAVTMLNACEFDVIEIEDIEPFARRLERYALPRHVVALAASLTKDNPVAFGTFQVYRKE